MTPRCSIRRARRPAPVRSTPASSACGRSRGRPHSEVGPVSGSKCRAARTSTSPSRTIWPSIHAAISPCRSTTSAGCVGTSKRGACARRQRRRSPDGRAATSSIRSATRSSWTRSMAEFHFSPRPNRAGEIAWRPWGDAAFAEARSEDKPVLLAISAVWCHWCHVMDETSYSDGEVIRGINERFVPIRVDNDERPDVNRRYNMGGWPTTAFLTPDGEILNGATYIPPDAMRHYVAEVADVWRDKRDELEPRLREMKEHAAHEAAQRPGDLDRGIVDAIAALIRGQYDPEFGGFGREPKFPQPKLLRFLLDEYRRSASEDVAAMLHKTLGAMASGGMYDPPEGGFFRYSTTRAWGVPHFEKMLEDNAELLGLYAEAHRTFPSAGYDRVARDVIRWMDATLWREDAQAFAGSQDADEHYYALDAAGRAAHGSPFVDRRIYAGWNALAASAYLAASNALGDPAPHARAAAVMRSLGTRMWDGRALAHVDPGDGPELRGLLADYTAAISTI